MKNEKFYCSSQSGFYFLKNHFYASLIYLDWFWLKIIICHIIAYRNFKYFGGIQKYRNEVSIPEIGIETRHEKVSIFSNCYHGQVSKSIDTWTGHQNQGSKSIDTWKMYWYPKLLSSLTRTKQRAAHLCPVKPTWYKELLIPA